MSEKRFTIVGEEYVGYTQGNAYIISNGECKFSLWESKEDAQKVCDCLNEQQAKIQELERKVKKYAKIGEEQLKQIIELQDKLKEKEEDEQLYANEIVKLNKEAKEVLDFKSLGGGY